jgi:superoxide dismutase, Fe-Mn family
MTDDLTRRTILTRAVPALALAGVVAAGNPLMALASAAAGDAKSDDKSMSSAMSSAFKDGAYVLPPLPYAYDALAPAIDADTMRLHHDKHHQAYVDGLNKTIKSLADGGSSLDANPALLSGLQEDLSFNAGGHFLHTVFWSAMAPSNAGGGGEPPSPLAESLAHDFGSVSAFRTRFSKVAGAVKGSGWAILAYEPIGDRLFILQAKQHDLQVVPGAIPLLPLDVWEHAYYLKYHNVRADYVKAWWSVVNWPAISDALVAARQARHAT